MNASSRDKSTLTQWGPALTAIELQLPRTSPAAIQLLIDQYLSQLAQHRDTLQATIIASIEERIAVLKHWRGQLTGATPDE